MDKKTALAQFHKETISAVAEELFAVTGIEKTTMDDIARTADYSKATLYVYFKNKEEIVQFIALKAMLKIQSLFDYVLNEKTDAIEQYQRLFQLYSEFAIKHPFQFATMMQTLPFDDNSRAENETLEKLYQVGEQVNRRVDQLIYNGICQGYFREDLPALPTGFVQWAAIGGIVQLSQDKKQYIQETMGMSQEEFLNFGFRMTLQSILKEGLTDVF